MADLKDFHHYKGKDLSPAEKVERKVVALLITTRIKDEDRESSITWELKHSSGCAQIGRILAQKRALKSEIAVAACVLHDIYVIVSGKYKNHARKGAPLALDIMQKLDCFSAEDRKTICSAVANHSEKEFYSDDPYAELVKDADVFDCSLYPGSEGYYRLHKSEELFEHYVRRIKKVRKELNLSEEPLFG